MYNVRHFGRDKYYLDNWYETKGLAQAAARRIRAMGNKARVISASRNGYETPRHLVYYKLD